MSTVMKCREDLASTLLLAGECAEAHGMTANICCGRPTRDIGITLTASTLKLVHCDRCDRHQWSQDGADVSLAHIMDSAARQWNLKLASV